MTNLDRKLSTDAAFIIFGKRVLFIDRIRDTEGNVKTVFPCIIGTTNLKGFHGFFFHCLVLGRMHAPVLGKFDFLRERKSGGLPSSCQCVT